MKLSVSIQAHPKRKEWAEDLSRKLNCPIAWDEKRQTWHTRKKAMLLADPNSEYHLVLQDDGIICEDFIDRAIAFIERIEKEFPNQKHAFQFYHGHRAGVTGGVSERDLLRGYVRRQHLTWGVAIVIPTEWIPDLIKFADKLSVPQDDNRIRRWLSLKKHAVVYPLPCFVDHRRVKENPTLVGGRNGDRYSPYFIDNI